MASSPMLRAAYLVHAPDLAERRAESLRLIDQHIAPLAETGCVERVSDFSGASVDPSTVELDPARCPLAEFRGLVRSMHVRQLSNAQNHLSALRRVAALPPPGAGSDSTWSRFALVLEDDALFSDTVAAALRRAAAEAPPGCDIVFLGLPSPLRPPPGGCEFEDALERFGGVVPACESYLVTREGARQLAGAFLPVRFPTHVQLSYAVRLLGMRAFLAAPNAFVDGSKLGFFASSLDPNNRLLWNQPFGELDALVASGREDDAEAARLSAAQPFPGHPDVLALRARYEARHGRFAEAESLFAAATVAYEREGCVVTNQSQFLKAYIALFRHLQQQ